MIKKVAFCVLIIGLLSFNVLSPYAFKGASNKGDKRITTKSLVTQKDKIHEPTKSGPTTYVPWEDNEEFKKLQIQYGATVMMASFCTVLRDPLPGEEDNVHLAAEMLAGTVLKPGELFSQNNRIGPYTRSRGFKEGPTYSGTRLITTTGGGVCKIASTLYNATILSNSKVIERYSHSMPVPYVPYGQDATVAYGARDFKFINNKDFPILIWSQGVGNRLYIAFYGADKAPKIEWHHELVKVFKAGKIYQYNSSLKNGEERLVMEGMDGAVAKSWITIENSDGTITTKQLGKSYYNPMPHLYERGN